METRFSKEKGRQYEPEYPQKIYAHQLITLEDLAQFKEQLFKELEALIKPNIHQPKKWLKSHEVQRYLKISPGTLQNLKSTGVIPYTKIGGVHFYDIEDIQKILQRGKTIDRIK